MTPWVVTTALLLVGVLDLVILVFVVSFAVTGNESLDFQWFGAHELLQGHNAYQVALDHPGRVVLEQHPNYLPLLYFLLLPFGALSFEHARVVWALLNPAMYVLAAVLIGLRAGLRGRRLFVFVSVGAANVSFILVCVNGQQTILVLLASVLALSLGTVGAGVGLAVSATKYSFLPPLGIAMLVRGGRRAVALGAALSLTAVAVFAAVTRTPFVRVLVQPLEVAQGRTADGIADVMTFSGYVAGENRASFTFLLGVGTCLLLLWGARRLLREGDWVDVLACCMLISLICFRHLVYDYAMLMTLIVPAVRAHGWRRGAIGATLVFFWYARLVLDQVVAAGTTWYVGVSLAVLLGCYVALVWPVTGGAPGSALPEERGATRRRLSAVGGTVPGESRLPREDQT